MHYYIIRWYGGGDIFKADNVGYVGTNKEVAYAEKKRLEDANEQKHYTFQVRESEIGWDCAKDNFENWDQIFPSIGLTKSMLPIKL
jgi:hypothetical protein